MAGTLTVDNLKSSTGVLAAQNGMTGIAKAWVRFNGTPATPTITNSFNISSVSKGSTGVYTVNFTTAMPNANYSYQLSIGGTSPDTGSNNVIQRNTGASLTDSLIVVNTRYVDHVASQQLDAPDVQVAIFA